MNLVCSDGRLVERNDLGIGCWQRAVNGMVWRPCCDCVFAVVVGNEEVIADREIEAMFEGVDGEIDL